MYLNPLPYAKLTQTLDHIATNGTPVIENFIFRKISIIFSIYDLQIEDFKGIC